MDKPMILIDEFHNIYIGTIERNSKGEIVRGECFCGDADSFYRNAIINVIEI